MKSFLIMTVAGIGLFSATVVGLLAATGRLNHEGTKDIPIIGGFFPEPADEPGGEDPDQADRSQDKGQTAPLLQREKPMGVNTDLLFERPKSQPVGSSQELEDETGIELQEPGISQHPRDGETPEDTRHRHDMEELFGQGQYRAGGYFRFQAVAAGIGADEINDMWRRAKAALKETEQRQSALDGQEKLLAVREQDLHDREETLAKKMKEIEAEQRKLDERIVQFHNDVKMVRNNEVEPLKSVASILASMEPETAALVVQDWWKTEESQDRALKILSVMDSEAQNAILAALPLPQIRDFLEKRLRLSREKSPNR